MAPDGLLPLVVNPSVAPLFQRIQLNATHLVAFNQFRKSKLSSFNKKASPFGPAVCSVEPEGLLSVIPTFPKVRIKASMLRIGPYFVSDLRSKLLASLLQ